MVDFQYKSAYTVEDLRKLIKVLRGEGGCPWDMVQTHESITRDFLEETYEAVEAIREGSSEHLKEELGDVLEQVVFHADIEEDAGRFTLDDVADAEVKKLIYRHPHVFGEAQAENAAQVLDAWDTLKRAEKSQETVTDAMEAVARSLPALWRAEKVQKKARKAGFDWPDAAGALDKVAEELAEVREAAEGDVAEELGDLLFACVNAVRLLGEDPENVLNAATDKFIRRFSLVEKTVAARGGDMKAMSLAELDSVWDEVKKAE